MPGCGVFTNPQLTLYAIDNRSQEVVRRFLGDDHLGVLISDCLASYDPHPGRKSKCCAHHLKAICEAQTQAPESSFLHDIHGLFKAAIVLHRLRADLPSERYREAMAALQRRLDELLEPPRGHAAEIRIRNRLRKQRPHLLTFLHVAGVDPTNNLAERQLRPAVIARKLSCGNRSQTGKAAFEVLASLAATCRQQGRSFTDLVVRGDAPGPLFVPINKGGELQWGWLSGQAVQPAVQADRQKGVPRRLLASDHTDVSRPVPGCHRFRGRG